MGSERINYSDDTLQTNGEWQNIPIFKLFVFMYDIQTVIIIDLDEVQRPDQHHLKALDL